MRLALLLALLIVLAGCCASPSSLPHPEDIMEFGPPRAPGCVDDWHDFGPNQSDCVWTEV